MAESVKDSVTTTAAALLIHYSFDLHGHTADELVVWWATAYQSYWVRSAVVEALYQGRYKAISVEQILAFWSRRGQPLYHFNHEFERIVCSKFPQALVPKSSSVEEPTAIAPLDAPLRIDWPSLPASLPADVPATTAPTVSEPAALEPAIAPVSPAGETPTAATESVLPALEPVLAESDPLLSRFPLPSSTETMTDSPQPEALDELDLEDGAVGQAKQAPIHQFVPNPKSTDFYTKLKAVAQSPEEVRAIAED